MELSFITTPEQATQIARPRGAFTVRFKRERFDALGLGLGLGDPHDAVFDFDGREKLWRLVRIHHDTDQPEVVDTGWVEAPRPIPPGGEWRD